MTETLQKIMAPFHRVKTAVSLARADGPDMPLVYVNTGFEGLTGYSAKSVLGRNCRFLQGRDTDPDAHVLIRRALSETREISICLLNYTADGRPFHNLLILSPVSGPRGEALILGCQCELRHGRQSAEIDGHLRAVDGVINRLTYVERPQEPWRQSLKSYQQRSDSVKMLTLNYLKSVPAVDS